MWKRGVMNFLGAGVTLAALLLGLAACLPRPAQISQAPVPQAPYWPTQGWRASTPEEQGFDAGKLADGLLALKQAHAAIDSLLIIRNGYVVVDAFFSPYDGSHPHDLASVTKSVTATLVGIAIDQGKLKPDAPLVSFFPGRTIANLDDRKRRITVRHLVSMMNGYTSGCLSGDEPTLNLMRSQPDWVQAALDRPVVEEPGKRFCYDSPGMHLLSAILQQATGMTELEFARQVLFEPLGIQEVVWLADPQGYTHGWGDLFLKPGDAAKIGYLWLNHGQWQGRQIVSASWLADSVKPHSDAGVDLYGYGIWIGRDAAPNDTYYAAGRGGQIIRVFPSYNAIIVVTAGDFKYDQLGPLLKASVRDPNKPLPANLQGQARLKAALSELARDSKPFPAGALPESARATWEKSMRMDPNPVNLASLRFEFKDPAEAALYVKYRYWDETWKIGLDGKYRLASGGVAARGYWADPQTFIVEVFDVGVSTFQFKLAGERLELSSPERGLNLTGQIESP